MSVTFNYSTFIARYPEFSDVSEQTAAAYFSEATLYCDNTGAGPITNDSTRAVLLNMLVAHIAVLAARDSQQVGRISSFSEGSVSGSIEGPPAGSGAWYQQSKYGAAYWQATVQYRRHRQFPASPRVMDPWQVFR